MSSQIYARYIPPAKNLQKDTQQVLPPSINQETASAQSQSIRSTTKDASQSYSRYVPPSKTKVTVISRVNGHDDTVNSPTSPDSTKRKHEHIEEENEDSSMRSKKQKKEKKITAKSESETVLPSRLQSKTIETATNDDGDSKEKRSKSAKKSRPSKSNDGGEAVDTEEDARHSKLLGKKEKSLRKAEKLAKEAAAQPIPDDVPVEEPPELHDLVPLPQPEPIPELAPQSLLSSLPPWLGNPVRVTPKSTASFASVGVSEEVEMGLQKKGFKHAFAVQAALLPRLLPGTSQEDGDFLVSAATGSGKTLSYILPMIENVSQNHVTKLRGLIVLPTRELVTQAKDVSEMCASLYSTARRIRIGTAVGNETFKAEQSSLMEQELIYDPEEYSAQIQRLNKKWEGSESGSDSDLVDDEIVSDLVDHVYHSSSKIDILICTPGRLVEHLKNTPGFTLEDIQWLVVDEADKLLDQSFQDWLDVVMLSLQKPRKIILSATITRDVGKLNGLKLTRPQLVVVEEQQEVQSDALFLPTTLRECAIKVDEEGVKPLYLLEILQRAGLVPAAVTNTEYSSDDESTSSSSSSSSSSFTSSDSDSADEATKTGKRLVAKLNVSPSQHGVLIFTKSNESAIRLGRLMALLKPSLAGSIGTLTSTTRSSDRKQAIRSFEAGKLSILVASDLVARGLDLNDLANVINYDIPTSLTSYVHRVGRTARAGKDGSAWTLHSSSEARWFWNEIGKADGVKRALKVERVKIDAAGFDRDLFEKALEALEKEASER